MIFRVLLHESCVPFVSLPVTSAREENANLEYFYFIPRRARQSGGKLKGRPGLFINDRARFHCASIFHARTERNVYFTTSSWKRSRCLSSSLSLSLLFLFFPVSALRCTVLHRAFKLNRYRQ